MPETKIYIDTNVYIDYFRNRSDNLRPLGEFAFQIFKRMFECEFRVIISSEVLKELKKNIHKDNIQDFLKQMEKFDKVDFIHVERSDMEKASKEKYKSHYEDRLHYVLAEKAQVEFFVTRNWKDFCGLGDIPVLTPELI